MRKTVDGKRLFSREFKIAAVKRVLNGERIGEVARDLDINMATLWRWKKRVVDVGEEHLYNVGARTGQERKQNHHANQERRIAELERLVGRQQAEIRFLDKALRRVEELRQEKKDDGAAASSKR
jgi:transposase-like protein